MPAAPIGGHGGGGRAEMRRLLGLLTPHRAALAGALLSLVAVTAITLFYPRLIGMLIDSELAGGDASALTRMLALMMGLFALEAVFLFTRNYLFMVIGERVGADLRLRLYGAILAQEVAFFDERQTGELSNRLTSDTAVLQNALSANLAAALRFGLLSAGGIGILVYTSPRLTGVMLAVVPLVVWVGLVFGRRVRRHSRDVQDALARANEIAAEAMSGIRTVRSFAREPEERTRYGTAVEVAYRLAVQRTRAIATSSSLISLGGHIAIILVIWSARTLVGEGQVTIGTLTSFLLYTLLIATALNTLTGFHGELMKAVGASQRVFELIDRVPRVVGPARGTWPRDPRGRVRFEDVDFAYLSRPERRVLLGFSLDLNPGEVVALVGPSGSGKSTVAALLPRLYDPQRGAITFDGIDLRHLDLDWLRAQIGVVSQEPTLFAVSIADNIRYGRLRAHPRDVEEVARAANAHDFIAGLPEGYDTLIGERGVRLSGGQRQRVAIARALLKDPRVLILDEATSALDAESELLVHEALDRLMHGRATLVIAHRLSTVRGATRVVVMHQGRVVQVGRHEELIAVSGLYRRLVERQFAGAPASPC
jgi:ATP-binding cassette subfamily B protein